MLLRRNSIQLIWKPPIEENKKYSCCPIWTVLVILTVTVVWEVLGVFAVQTVFVILNILAVVAVFTMFLSKQLYILSILKAEKYNFLDFLGGLRLLERCYIHYTSSSRADPVSRD